MARTLTPGKPYLPILALVCTSQALAQLGAYAIPALLPTFITEWGLSNTQAGWIGGGFFLAYVVTVPVLVALTDRIDPKQIYLLGVTTIALAGLGYAWLADGFWSAFFFRALWGVGWAGTYMPGLKALSDLIEGREQSRAVAVHAASVGISSSVSFILSGTIAEVVGWRWAVAMGRLRRSNVPCADGFISAGATT